MRGSFIALARPASIEENTENPSCLATGGTNAYSGGLSQDLTLTQKRRSNNWGNRIASSTQGHP